MSLLIDVLESSALQDSALNDISDLCTNAYSEDFTGLIELLGPGVHVIGRYEGAIVSHAMWITRWLDEGGCRSLRTAYVEAVATAPTRQRRGFASAILQRLAEEIEDYDLGVLCPTDAAFYTRLGWVPWRGPLFIKTDAGLLATPEEEVMVLRIPRTPADLDLTRSLSAEWREGELW